MKAMKSQIAIRITYKKETKSVKEWSKITGVPTKTLIARFNKGWNHNKIIEFPYKKREPTGNKVKKYTIDDELSGRAPIPKIFESMEKEDIAMLTGSNTNAWLRHKSKRHLKNV